MSSCLARSRGSRRAPADPDPDPNPDLNPVLNPNLDPNPDPDPKQARPATSPAKHASPGGAWITAGPRSYVGPRPASTQPRARVHPRAQRTLPVGGVRLPDASGAVSAPVTARPSRVSTPREIARPKPGAAWLTPRSHAAEGAP